MEPLPFTQGKLAAIAPDGTWYEVVTDEGHLEVDDRNYFSERPVSYVMDPKARCWKEGMVDLSPTRVERAGPRRFRLHWSRRSGPETYPVAAGDGMAFRGKLRHHAASVRDWENIWFEGAIASDLILARAGGRFQPGDRLGLFDRFNVPVGEAIVAAVEPVESFSLAQKSERSTIGDISVGPYVGTDRAYAAR